jgi:hypothetical protein
LRREITIIIHPDEVTGGGGAKRQKVPELSGIGPPRHHRNSLDFSQLRLGRQFWHAMCFLPTRRRV